MASWKQGAQVFRTMPWRSLITFLSGVALLFAAFGAVQDAMSVEQAREPRLIFSMVMSRVSAAMWALFGSMRMTKSLIALTVVQIAVVFLLAKTWPAKPQAFTLDQLQLELLSMTGLYWSSSWSAIYSRSTFSEWRATASSLPIQRSASPRRSRENLYRRFRKRQPISSSMAFLCRAARSAAISWMS
jgi:hypothetical protein